MKRDLVWNVLLIVALVPLATLEASTQDGWVKEIKTVVSHGNDSQHFNIAILGDGFTEGELGKYRDKVDEFIKGLSNHPTFKEYFRVFNIYRIDIVSNESGADKKGSCFNPPVERKTYLDTYYCAGSPPVNRCIWSSDFLLIDKTVKQASSCIVFTLVLVNDSESGGCANSQYSFVSSENDWFDVAFHELGHLIADLGDEYEECQCRFDGSVEPKEVNLTIETDPRYLKWADLLPQGIPPSIWYKSNQCEFQDPPAEKSNVVGLYEGGGRLYTCGIFRPQPDCLMRSLRQDFCPVCKQEIRRILSPYLLSEQGERH